MEYNTYINQGDKIRVYNKHRTIVQNFKSNQKKQPISSVGFNASGSKIKSKFIIQDLGESI